MVQAAGDNTTKNINAIAGEVLSLARDEILLSFRFLDRSLMELKCIPRPGTMTVMSDIGFMYYDPLFLLQEAKRDYRIPSRTLFHVLLHHIFAHPFAGEKTDAVLWDLACDIAVENVIAELNDPSITVDTDAGCAGMLKVLREDIGMLSVEKIYRYFRKNPLTPSRVLEYERAFARDDHSMWRTSAEAEMVISEEEWKKISRQVLTEIKNFSEKGTSSESLEKNLSEGAAIKYDYAKLLQRFLVNGESNRLSEDEFDYIYYTYGLEKYDNMPLIEPLEYREEKRIKDFVIAIDTSASCSGEIVRKFIRQTFDLLKNSESFFRKVNIHILQCDSEVKSDDKITDTETLDIYLEHMKLYGGGATDFRPVFSYVDDLKEKREFDDLKGIIYFTDGYGIYPEKKPDTDVIFVFLNNDPGRMGPPAWSMKAIIDEEELG